MVDVIEIQDIQTGGRDRLREVEPIADGFGRRQDTNGGA
jgi:hypothetical protein